MKKYIHINQHVIRSNAKSGEREPVITVKTYKSNNYGHEVTVDGPCKIVYSPDKPLSCGAKVWIETESNVEVAWVDNPGQQWPEYSCSMRAGSRIRDQATSTKPQAASVKPQAWQD